MLRRAAMGLYGERPSLLLQPTSAPPADTDSEWRRFRRRRHRDTEATIVVADRSEEKVAVGNRVETATAAAATTTTTTTSRDDVVSKQATQRAREEARWRELEAQMGIKMFGDVYGHVLRALALLLEKRTLDELRPPACRPMTRDDMYNVYAYETVEYEMQFVPLSASRRALLFLFTYGAANRAALVDAERRVEFIDPRGLAEHAFRGSVYEALLPPRRTATSGVSISAGGAGAGDSSSAAASSGFFPSQTRGGGGGGDGDDATNGGPTDMGADASRAHDLVVGTGMDDGDAPALDDAENGADERERKTARRIERSGVGGGGGAVIWLRDTLVWSGTIVIDRTLPERTAYIDHVTNSTDDTRGPADGAGDDDDDDDKVGACGYARLKKVSTMNLEDSQSVLIDATPFFQTYFPAMRRRRRRSARHRVSPTLPRSVLELRSSSSPSSSSSRGDAEKDGESGDEREEIDLEQESFSGEYRMWLVPVANSYLLGDVVPPERLGRIVTPAPLLEICRRVTIACATRFDGREIVCHALTAGESASAAPARRGGGGGRRSQSRLGAVLCRIRYAPDNAVHALLSAAHRDASESGGSRSSSSTPMHTIYARLVLRPDQRWSLHEVVAAAGRLAPGERETSTGSEIARRANWVSRAEYCEFLRAVDAAAAVVGDDGTREPDDDTDDDSGARDSGRDGKNRDRRRVVDEHARKSMDESEF